jgi:predicted secreted hydrolase
MATRTVALFFLFALALSLALNAGCGGEAESLPYGPPQVQLPEDEGAHPEAGVEWWYLNSLLTDAEGRQYGAMAAYFNAGLKIVSISDLEGGHFYPEVTFGIPDYAEGPLDLRWGSEDRWHRTDADPLSYSLEAHGGNVSLSLGLVSEKPPLLVGGDGLIEWTDSSSYYYSLTRLDVEGRIELAGRDTDVSGIGWMDHQWMDSLSDSGWDWFSVQLDNDTDLIFWRIVDPDGAATSRDLTVMLADNSVYHTLDISLEKLDSWVSPDSGREYGTLWRLQEETHGIDLQIAALLPEAEISVFKDFEGMDFYFWEGATAVSGTFEGETVTGTGYAELVRPPTGVPEGASNPWGSE